MEPILIGSRREPMWDDFLIDTSKTDTPLKLHHPVQRDRAIFTEPWAQGSSPYLSILQDGDRYLMYTSHTAGLVCSQSTDGIHWERPSLGLVEYEGSRDNALVSFEHDGPDSAPRAMHFDGFRAFADTNPACPPEERIKAMANVDEHLRVYASPDGLRFRMLGVLPIRAQNPGTPFDSINTLFYDRNIGKYRAYVRDYFSPSNSADGIWIRAISGTESEELFPKKGGWPKARYLQYDTPNAW